MRQDIHDILRAEREISDRNYAVKLVERIVFALVSIICVAVVAALLQLVIIK